MRRTYVLAGVLGLAGCGVGPAAIATPAASAPSAATTPGAPADATIESLSWLSGRWVSVDGEATTEETWTEPGPDAMFGVSRTTAGGRTVFFEYLRIEATADGLVYYASPKGRCPPTAFTATEVGPADVTFANPAHDDPKSIAYVREGDTLRATIDGPRGPSGWTYTRAP